jgi:hypothetical protein
MPNLHELGRPVPQIAIVSPDASQLGQNVMANHKQGQWVIEHY